jgi:transcriptional regulator with XRE-family HTH domain
MNTKNLPLVSGETIRRLRQLKGIKQAVAAKRLGITQQAYSKIESGRLLSENKLQAVLAIFEITPKDIENIQSLLSPPPPTHTTQIIV